MKLKRLFSAACGAALLVSAACSVGCDNRIYDVYTNIPQGDYEITDSSFRLGEGIGGYTAPDVDEGEPVDTSNYSGKGTGFSAMFTQAELVVYTDFSADGAAERFTAFAKVVGSTVDGISKAVSSTVTDSDVYNFNNAPAGATVQVSETVYEILEQALAVYNLTECYYNPALYYNIQAYGFSSAESYPQTAADLPDNETVEKYADLASHFGDVATYEENGKYYVTKPAYTVEVGGETLSLKLDLGGIAKGYAVDRVEELFDSYGYQFGYFNFGASSMLVKKYPDGESFNIEFVNPRSNKRDGYVKVKTFDEKLSTSGDNEQRYFIDGVRYCHIIDPTTGKPVQTGIMSVTIIGGSAAEDDALTTAIMAMGKEKAISFIEEHLTDRKVVFTCG